MAERVPQLVLPPPRGPAVDRRPRLIEGGVPVPEAVPSHPSRIQDLGILPVVTRDQRAVWNALIAQEHPHAPPIVLSAVHLRESPSPEDEPPIQWSLLTTLPVSSADEAARVVGHYHQRGRVEDFSAS